MSTIDLTVTTQGALLMLNALEVLQPDDPIDQIAADALIDALRRKLLEAGVEC